MRKGIISFMYGILAFPYFTYPSPSDTFLVYKNKCPLPLTTVVWKTAITGWIFKVGSHSAYRIFPCSGTGLKLTGESL
jgi:hypothetical protein